MSIFAFVPDQLHGAFTLTWLRRSIIACFLVLFFPIVSWAQGKPRETVVYTTLRPPNQDIYLVDPAEEEPRRLTDHLGLDYNPAFAPDGQWLVFTSDRDGNTDLYALNLERDGEPVRLTWHRGMDDAADVSEDGEEIVFVSTRAGNADVHVMPFRPEDPTSAEKEAVNLTRHPLGDFQPAFSPDGSTIAFSRQLQRAEIQVENPRFRGPAQNVMTHVFLMDRDGSDVRRLVGEVPFRPRAGHMTSGWPAWSKDGKSLYYHAASFDEMGFGSEWAADLWRVGADGSDARPSLASDSLHMLSPAVGPRGQIVFHGEPPLPPREQLDYEMGTIYAAAADGSELRREIGPEVVDACFAPAVGPGRRVACHGPGPVEGLSPKADGAPLLRPGTHATVELPDRTVHLVGMHGYFPDFLSDGRVAYGESLPQTGYVERHGIPPIVTSRLDGTERRVVLDTDSLRAWATSTCRRDGRIAFNTGPDFAPVDAPVDIWTMGPDGTGLTNLTNDDTSNDAFPAWSADCEHIVFRSGRDGNKEIYVMEDDGTDRRRLTRHPATETAPAISPDGQWVVFATGRDHTTPEDAEDLVPISRQGRGGGAGFRLWIQRLDGTEGRFLEPGLVGVPGRDMHPQFSPDGKWVLFISSRGGINDESLLASGPQPYGELWAIPVEGGRAVRLTHDKWEDGLARWGFVGFSRR